MPPARQRLEATEPVSVDQFASKAYALISRRHLPWARADLEGIWAAPFSGPQRSEFLRVSVRAETILKD